MVWKKCLLILVLSVWVVGGQPDRVQSAPTADPLGLSAEAALMVDIGSGRILFQKNTDALLPPGSMTKMMSEYLFLEAIKEGKLKWDQQTGISDYVYRISQNRSLSNVPLRKDKQYTVQELYESMAIYSANGSTIALAELLAGSETSFLKMMRDKAQSFGMKDFQFVNSTGLNNGDLQGMHPAGTGASEENMMSAREVATLGFRLLADHPEVLQISSIPKKVFREGTSDAIKMENWNWMLPGLVYGYQGMDGLKTGSTDLGGFSFTGTAQRNNMRLLAVVMRTGSYQARFGETKQLLDYGFSNFGVKEIAPAGFQTPPLLVTGGRAKTVIGVTEKPLAALVKSGEERLVQPVVELEQGLLKEGMLVAPLAQGQVVGRLAAKYQGAEDYGYLVDSGKEKVEVAASTSVKRELWIVRLFRSIWNMLRSIRLPR